MIKVFNFSSWKKAQAAPPLPPPPPPPPAGGAPGETRSGVVSGVDSTKVDNTIANDDDHLDQLNKFFKALIKNHDMDTAIALTCAADGSRVTPGMIDMQLTGEGAPRIRGINGIERGPAPAQPLAGAAPPLPPPM